MLSPYDFTALEIISYFGGLFGTCFGAGLYTKALKSTINQVIT